MKAKYPPDLLQKIRESVNIADVIGEHVVLRKSGSNYSGLCPFHAERTPSFSVSESKQLYHCYGCKKGGDLFSFVMEMFGIGFPEAVEELAERGRVTLPKEMRTGTTEAASDPELQKRRAEAREKFHTAHKLTRFIAAYYHHQLQTHSSAREYLKKRGVGPELIKNFYIGAASQAWDALATYLQTKKAPITTAVELGLIRPSTKDIAKPSASGYFDFFRDRVMFPILDLRGKVSGFGGRLLSDSGDTRKYLNSPESMLFHKSKLAFGLYQAQKYIREKDEIVLVEGYFDVLALHAAGFQNVVSTCGTALSPDHLNLFKKFASRVIILFDGDKAGISATERAMEIGLENGVILYGASIPEGLDPDEVLFDQTTGVLKTDGKERMQGILASASPLLDARIEELSAQALSSPEAKSLALKRVASWLGMYKDPVGREVRIDAVTKKLGVTRSLLSQAGGGAMKSETPQPGRSSQVGRAGPPIRPRQVSPDKARPTSGKPLELSGWERILLTGIAKSPQYFELMKGMGAQLPPSSTPEQVFEHPVAKDFTAQLLGGGAGSEASELLSALPVEAPGASQVRSVLTEALVSEELPFGGEEFRWALEHAVARFWARFSQGIRTALQDAEAKKDAGLHAKLLQEYLDVQRKMKEFISFYDEA